jgi:hypothetical protein
MDSDFDGEESGLGILWDIVMDLPEVTKENHSSISARYVLHCSQYCSYHWSTEQQRRALWGALLVTGY